MTQMTFKIKSDTLKRLGEILTGYGRIDGIDHEGTITWTLLPDSFEIEDDFAAGSFIRDIQCELRCYESGIEIERVKKQAK